VCGITGFWDFKNHHSIEKRLSIIKAMADQIRSRGPDGEGFWTDKENGLTLGHRRLSIIDLSSKAAQPMESACGRFVLSYNGEVYNFPELRGALERQGVRFKSHSDTEVILEACALYGVKETASKLIGMFAFALWDKKAQKIYLVRDRLGIKPLYWGILNHTLFFGSQLKSFHPHPAWMPRLHTHALSLYFQYKYVPAPFSIYENIFKLEPGHILTIDACQKIQKESFWDLESIITHHISQRKPERSLTETMDELENLVEDSVKRILISDVPVGCFLSGGVDSSLIAATMQSLSKIPIQTFSIGFEHAEYNEAPQAKRVAEFLKTNHHEEILTEKKCLDIVPTLATFYDEPFADSSQIPTYLVSALAKKTVTVVLSGDGGDELFGGYNRYKAAHHLWNTITHLPKGLRSMGASTLRSLPPGFFNSINALLPEKFSQSNLPNKIEKIARILRASSEEEFYQCLATQDITLKKLLAFNVEESPSLRGIKNLSFIENMQYWDMKTYLPDDILAKVDRATMAVGLEARVPFLDHRVVEFSWSLPEHFKVNKGDTKWILRQLLYKKIPSHLFSSPKKGFAVPIGGWLKGPLRKWAEDMIYSASFDHINSSYIQQLWKEHIKGTHDHHEVLWSYLMYIQWNSSYK
jgi:asparagine synthase (glutamine-hydrolysing)